MLNLITYDISDQPLLEKSYEALRNKQEIEIVTDEKEKEKILRYIIESVKIPNGSQFSFQNLFKQRSGSAVFYLAQGLVNFGYVLGSKGTQSSELNYNYAGIGFAEINKDLGITNMRPETRTDKIIGRFFKGDIDFATSPLFSDKYYLASDKRTETEQCFNRAFLEAVAKYDQLLICVDGNRMFISFDDFLNEDQLRGLQDIFSKADFLKQSKGV